MPVLIVILKILIAVVYGSIVYSLYRAHQSDHSMKFHLDLISSIEVCFGIGLALISLFSVITESTYIFTAALCSICLILAFCHKRRLVFAGNTMLYYRAKTTDLKQVVKLRPEHLLFLRIDTKKESQKIYVPLTDHNALENIQNSLKKRKLR